MKDVAVFWPSYAFLCFFVTDANFRVGDGPESPSGFPDRWVCKWWVSFAFSYSIPGIFVVPLMFKCCLQLWAVIFNSVLFQLVLLPNCICLEWFTEQLYTQKLFLCVQTHCSSSVVFCGSVVNLYRIPQQLHLSKASLTGHCLCHRLILVKCNANIEWLLSSSQHLLTGIKNCHFLPVSVSIVRNEVVSYRLKIPQSYCTNASVQWTDLCRFSGTFDNEKYCVRFMSTGDHFKQNKRLQPESCNRRTVHVF